MSKHFINDSATCVADSLRGLLWQRPDLMRLPGTNAIVKRNMNKNSDDDVAIICGGGSGHEPAHAGFVYDGCLDGAVCGDVFASPSHKAVLDTIKHCAGVTNSNSSSNSNSKRRGVLVLIKNYNGDCVNFGIAAKIATAQFGIPVECVVFGDDVAFGAERGERRGLAGVCLLYKILGHVVVGASSKKKPVALSELATLARSLSASMRTFGVSMSGCTLPGKHQANVVLGATEMEAGLGIHGEAGSQRLASIPPARELAAMMVDKVLDGVAGGGGGGDVDVVLALNNLGSVTELEMSLLVDAVMSYVVGSRPKRGVKVNVVRLITGRFMTSLDMKGVSLTAFLAPSADALAALDVPCPPWIHFACCKALAAPPVEEQKEAASVVDLDANAAAAGATATEEGTRLHQRLVALATALESAEDKFDALDAATGDGDAGRSIARGMRAAKGVLAACTGRAFSTAAAARAAFSEIGSAVADQQGGSSGPLVGSFIAVGCQQLQASPSAVGDWLRVIGAGCDALQQVGGAKVGDRTMVDVLRPVADLATEISGSEVVGDAKAALEKLLAVAKKAALDVQQLTAKKGRSRYLEEKVVGKPDPGCELVVVVLEQVLKLI